MALVFRNTGFAIPVIPNFPPIIQRYEFCAGYFRVWRSTIVRYKHNPQSHSLSNDPSSLPLLRVAYALVTVTFKSGNCLKGVLQGLWYLELPDMATQLKCMKCSPFLVDTPNPKLLGATQVLQSPQRIHLVTLITDEGCASSAV